MGQIQKNHGNNAREWAEQVADEIRGVPFPSQKNWMENEDFQKWYRRLAKPQPVVQDRCELYYLSKDIASRREKDRKRSAMLYSKKMKEEMKPMEVLRCAVHGAEKEVCIPISK
jgi:hypothetical protein